MRVHVENLTHIDATRNLVFAAVQLARPALEPIDPNRTFEWRAPQRADRLRDVREILKIVFSRDVCQSPDFLIFPEYSVPQEAIREIPFQELSSRNRCVIVAGSYFDTDKHSEFFRNNLCHIYIPDRATPLVLCKFQSSPRELRKLTTSKNLPNVARLVWQPARRAAVSISIFLCRDYLVPFQKRSSTSDASTKIERVSLLDWDREGINIVVMNNRDSSLFEGSAALDVRRTHGKRKLVLLVNSANTENRLATAMLGASQDPDRAGDVAAKMPTDQEGMLVLESRLWRVGGTKETPDTVTSFPIAHWQAYSYLNSRPHPLLPITKELSVGKRRGIFHPAFLEAMRKDIVIELYVAKSTQRVEKAFLEEKIRHVTARHVRGIEDILIRRYVERYTVGTRIPDLGTPYSYLTKAEFEHAFDKSTHAAHIKILIEPRSIMKFRGVEVPDMNDDEWRQACEAITDSVDMQNIGEVISIAKELPEGQAIPAKYSKMFSLGIETITPVGKEFGNDIRETLMLISSEDSEGKPATSLFSVYIKEHLMRDQHVRDIYKLDRISPEVVANPFRFALRLKCSVFDVDDMLHELQLWAGRNNIRVGTRSYDLWRNISRNATDGILDSKMTEAELKLLDKLLEIDPDANWVLDRELRERIAEAVRQHSNMLRGMREIDRHMSQFFCFTCLFNLNRSDENKRNYSEKARTEFASLYRFVEAAAKALLGKALQALPNPSNKQIAQAIAYTYPEKYEKVPDKEKNDPLRLFVRFYDELVTDDAADVVERMKIGLQYLGESRNWAVHGGNEALWRAFIKLDPKGWQKQFDKLDLKVRVLCELIAALNKELLRREASTEV